MNNKTAVLECKHVGKSYIDSASSSIQVLKEVSLAIAPGEQVAIMGCSGSGKTTLLQLMGGLDHPTQGHIFIQGKDIHQLSEKERGRLRNQSLGFIYQLHHLLPEFTALENTMMPLLIAGMDIKTGKVRALELLEQVGLSARLHHRPSELSGGERQRVAIARALVNHPACVLADEPTGNLDAENAQQIFDLIQSLNRQYNITFVIVTHDNGLAKRLDRTLVLKNGVLQIEK